MKTYNRQASATTKQIVSVANLLKNHRQFQNDISNNIQHWLSIISFNAQSIIGKTCHDENCEETEKLALQILDACGDLENFHKCIFTEVTH